MERQACQACGNPMLTVIPGVLTRCSVCGLYHRERAPSAKNLPEQEPEKPTSITGEMKVFAERVIYALCAPDKGYAPVIVREVKGIYEVLDGRKEFDEWFTKVRQALGLKNYQLAKVLYDCLEGLKSMEATQLREQWYGFLQAEMKGYGLA